MNRKYKNGWRSELPLCPICGVRLSTRAAKTCKKCYHKSMTGDGNHFYGKHHSEEWKIEISKSRKAYVPSEETKRKLSEHNIRTGKKPPLHHGENHWNWKGGIRPLEKRIREIKEYSKWREGIFERDDYTCKKCLVRGVRLRAHHKKQFHVILNEFLNKYNNFDVVEDADVLVELARSYDPFWDITNGETSCNDCHLKEHTNTGSMRS